MRFSRAYSLSYGASDEWFDPDLTVDTRLFVDPFLLLKAGAKWADAHDELIAHFAHCYHLVAKAPNRHSVSAKSAVRLLTFPEPYEFGLGYTVASTRGSGGGAAHARVIMDGIAVALAAGLKRPEHIEEIGILNEGFGADRISDAALNVLKPHFIRYTQAVAKRRGVPMRRHTIRNASLDRYNARWSEERKELPTNTVTGGPVLLVPKKLLRDLPTLNAEDWFQSDVNAEVREHMNLSVGQSIPKREIVKLARRDPEAVRAWARGQASRKDLMAYDFGVDPKGVISYDKAAEFAEVHPLPELPVPQTQAELSRLIHEVLLKFKAYIEHGGGWSLLWNDDDRSEKREEAAQLAFMGMAREYLRLFGVEVDREVELGRGPVDFKVSSGRNIRLLIEVKKDHSGKFWNGLEDQLPSYLASDDTTEGWFVSIQYRDTKLVQKRLQSLPQAVRDAAERTGKDLHYVAIDGRRPPSASKIRNTAKMDGAASGPDSGSRI